MIRVALPAHLRTLARIEGEVHLELQGMITMHSLLDALESQYPMLRGTIRDQHNGERRAFVRYFACKEDLSHLSQDENLPEEVTSGKEILRIIGAMSGG